MFEQVPIGLSYATPRLSLYAPLLQASNTYREWWVVSQRRIQGIPNGKIDGDLK
jgi:hypothetical protein